MTVDDEFFVEFEAYDIHNWNRLVRRQLFCPINDLICVHDGFLMAIEQSISPFLTDALDIDATISSLDEGVDERTPSYDINNEDLIQIDDLNDTSQKNNLTKSSQGQYGNRYYREFDLKNNYPDFEVSKKENSQRLLNILDQILTNPYDVVIGDECSIDCGKQNENNENVEKKCIYFIRHEHSCAN